MEVFTNKNELSEDLHLVKQAVRGRWNVPQDIKDSAIRTIRSTLQDMNIEDPKIKLEAIKIAALLDKIDLEEEKMHTPKKLQITKTSTVELFEKLQELVGHDAAIEGLKRRMLPSTGG